MQKILLLEDNPQDANLVGREVISRWPGVELITVSHLAEARKLLHDKSNFDVALFDLNLPDGNGMDLLSELREKNCQIPIIIFTSDGSEGIAITALKIGANDYIPKKVGFHKRIVTQIEFTLNQSLVSMQHLSVLYVEHNKADVDLTQHYFKKHAPNIHLTVVPNGDEVLKLLPKQGDALNNFDILLLDYNLPGLNALEISKTIRQERKLSIAIVIVTGQGDEKIAVEALKIGIDDYIVKSKNYLIHLPSTITSAYRRRELERQKRALILSETKYRLLADYASDWEYWINPEGEYIYISPVCEKTSGYSPAAFMKNKNLLIEITLPEYRAIVKEHIENQIEELHAPIEFQILSADGQEKWISHFCRPVYDDNNNYLGKRGVNRDITERKQAELELLQSEVRFKRLFDDLGDAVFVTVSGGADMGKILEVNTSAIKQTGYSREELLKMNIIHDLSVPNSGTEVSSEDSDRKLLSGDTVNYMEKKRRKNGEEYWTEIIITPIEYNGKLAGLSINRDITERKQAEEVLLKMNKAINNAGDIIFITDREGIITFINPEFTRMYGYTQEEVVGKTTPGILKSGDFKKEELEYFWNALLNNQNLPTNVYRNKCKDGKLIDIESSVDTIVDENNDVVGFIAIQRDISDRKRAEKIQQVILNISNATQTAGDLGETMKIIQIELGSLMDTENFFVALYDKETDRIHLPYFQDEKDRITDFPAGKTITGMVIKEGKSLLIDSEKAKKLEEEEKIEKVGFDSEIWLGVPLKMKGKVTGAFVVQSYTNPNAYTEKDLEVLEIISHQISISIERKRDEEKLMTALEAAKESDRVKTAFLANMSHELRTPLNAVIGFSSLIDDKTDPRDSENFAQLILKSGNNLLSIVDDIFEITLLEQDTIDIKRSKMPISSFLSDILQTILHRQKNTGVADVRIELDIKGIEPFTSVYTDFDKLRQVFLSILGNSLKFTHEGFIHFGVYPSENGKDFVFFVKDTGIGIAKEKHQNIFERFKIGDETLTRKYPGIGLGLFICEKLVKALGGEIWLESEEGMGSTFYFSVPR